MLQELFPHLFCTLCLYPAPYDRAKVACVCVYSNLRFSVCVWLRSCPKKIEAMVVRMVVTMSKFSVLMAIPTHTENQG